MKVEDLRSKGAGWQILLHEKGGKEHFMPCHHALAEALRAYIDAAGTAEDRKGWLYRTSPRHNATVLTEQPMAQADAWRMIRRRAKAAGIAAPIGNHTFRATGITAYLGNGGVLEHAQSMAAHAKPSHDQALRPHAGAVDAGRGGEDQALKYSRTPIGHFKTTGNCDAYSIKSFSRDDRLSIRSRGRAFGSDCRRQRMERATRRRRGRRVAAGQVGNARYAGVRG